MAVFYGHDAFSMLVHSIKKWCSSFLKKGFVFHKICFKVKVLKTIKIFTDFYIKICWFSNGGLFWKSPIPSFRRAYPANIRLYGDVLKTSLAFVFRRRLQDVLIKANIFASVIRFQKTSWSRPRYSSWLYFLQKRLQEIFKASSRRFEDVFRTSYQDVFKMSCKNVFKTSSRRLAKMSSRHFQDVSSG